MIERYKQVGISKGDVSVYHVLDVSRLLKQSATSASQLLCLRQQGTFLHHSLQCGSSPGTRNVVISCIENSLEHSGLIWEFWGN